MQEGLIQIVGNNQCFVTVRVPHSAKPLDSQARHVAGQQLQLTEQRIVGFARKRQAQVYSFADLPEITGKPTSDREFRDFLKASHLVLLWQAAIDNDANPLAWEARRSER